MIKKIIYEKKLFLIKKYIIFINYIHVDNIF